MSTRTSPSRPTCGPRAPRFRDRVPHVERVDGRDIWLLDGDTIAVVGATATAGFPESMPTMPQRYDDIHPACVRPARTACATSTRWVSRPSCSTRTSVASVASASSSSATVISCTSACARTTTSRSTGRRPIPRRLIPVASLPFWDVDDCVREIERCAALGFKTLLFTGEPHRFDLPYLGEAHWERLWDAAVAHDMPVNFHVGSGEFTWDTNRMASRGFAELCPRGSRSVPQERSAGVRSAPVRRAAATS